MQELLCAGIRDDFCTCIAYLNFLIPQELPPFQEKLRIWHSDLRSNLPVSGKLVITRVRPWSVCPLQTVSLLFSML